MRTREEVEADPNYVTFGALPKGFKKMPPGAGMNQPTWYRQVDEDSEDVKSNPPMKTDGTD